MQFVAKNRAATRFQYHHRSTCGDMGSQRGQVAAQIGLGHVEKPIVVERPPAAKVLIENLDLTACVFQNFHGSSSRLRHEVVIERIGPQKDFWPRAWTCFAAAEPCLKRLRRERWNLSLSWNP